MRIIVMLAFAVLFPALGMSDTLTVPGMYDTIQDAIVAAKNGDTVQVDPGTYTENIDFLGKAITVKSTGGPKSTAIDGGKSGSVVVFMNGEGPDSILEGFSIRNGSGTYEGTVYMYYIGGGIYCEGTSPTITQNQIHDNTPQGWSYGGGLGCLLGGSPLIDNNVFFNNETCFGGGIFCGDNTSAIVRNNTIYSCLAGDEHGSGGGISCTNCSPQIENNTIFLNKATENGGGIYCEGSSPVIEYNTILDNYAAYMGGGISCYTDTAVIRGNIIQGNWTGSSGLSGGGIRCSGINTVISDNLILQNWGYLGGGIYAAKHTDLVITGNTICENSAESGGGVYCNEGVSEISDNLIYGNSCKFEGGGIKCWESDPVISNNIFHANSSDEGGGIYFLLSKAVLVNNTFFKNSVNYFDGGAICCDYDCSLTISNTICWNNYAPQGPEISIASTAYPSTVSISYSDVDGGPSSVHVDAGCTLNWGAGMIDASPQFVDSANNDLHILYTSPCRNGGDNAAAGLPAEDFEGDPRIAEGAADMGADEFHTHFYVTGDSTPGGSIELKFAGWPGASPVQLWLGSGVMDPPMHTKYGDWYLQFPLLLDVGLGSIPSPGGVLILPVSIPASVPTPLDLPMQAGVGAELTNPFLMKVE